MTKLMFGGAAAATLALALSATPARAQCSFHGLNGDWRANDGGTYRIHEQGNRVWWIAMSGDGGRSWQHKFQGTRSGDIVTGNWADFRGPMGRGTLTIKVRDVMSMRRIANTGSGFGGVHWWRGCNDTAGGPGSD